jgi:GH25 family lysozyme M1 (1,4-beta-N-acetylmuramidase)
MRRWLGGLVSVALAAGVVVAVAPTASAAPPVVGGVVRDNVENTHSPRMGQEFPDGVSTRSMEINAAYVKGIDVASHQHPNGAAINWGQVAASGIRFAGIKASEGNYYTNPYFANDQAGAQAAGMYSFAYHFATPYDSTGAVQADYFLDRAGYNRNGKTLRPALDLEWNPYPDSGNACYDMTPAQLVAWTNDFVNRVKQRIGVAPIIYTAASWWRDCVGGSTAFGSLPLWVASYTTNPAPSLPAGWSNWTMWQYSDSTSVPGISAKVDGNYAQTEAALAALAVKASEPSGYTSVAPTRVLDTRNATGAARTTPLGANTSITLDLSGRLPATATAAVLNVTGIASLSTVVTVWPSGSNKPSASSLNLAAKEIRSNLVTVQVGADRKVQLHNNSGNTHLIADLAGWYATDAAGLNTAVAPLRVLDTRYGTGASGAVKGGSKITLNLSSRVPESATAVTLNLTGVGATLSTFVLAWPTGQARPTASNVNIANANPTSNLVTVQLGTNRSVDLYNNSGQIHVVADLAGYYSPDAGKKFVALSPMRMLDTRTKPTTWQSVSGGGQAIPLTMRGPIPEGATAAVLNLTGVTPTLATYVAANPKTATTPARPTTSNLNLAKGQIAAILASVALGPNQDVWLFNNAGSIHVIADLAGYFA